MKREGVAQIVRGDYDAAVATFKAALAHDPNQGELGVGFDAASREAITLATLVFSIAATVLVWAVFVWF